MDRFSHHPRPVLRVLPAVLALVALLSWPSLASAGWTGWSKTYATPEFSGSAVTEQVENTCAATLTCKNFEYYSWASPSTLSSYVWAESDGLASEPRTASSAPSVKFALPLTTPLKGGETLSVLVDYRIEKPVNQTYHCQSEIGSGCAGMNSTTGHENLITTEIAGCAVSADVTHQTADVVTRQFSRVVGLPPRSETVSVGFGARSQVTIADPGIPGTTEYSRFYGHVDSITLETRRKTAASPC